MNVSYHPKEIISDQTFFEGAVSINLKWKELIAINISLPNKSAFRVTVYCN